VDALRFGRQFRALRIRQGKRQSDVSAAAGLSRSLIAAIDRGQLGGVTIASIVRVSTALGADVDLRLRYRGEQLDRLLDEDHAALVDTVVRRLTSAGWTVEVETSFSIWGERGSIDVLAYQPATGAVLVVEVKSIVPDSQAVLHGLDRKARLAPKIADSRSWSRRHVSRLLVIGDTSTSRRRIARLGATYDAAFGVRGRDVASWLARPDRPIAGLLFLPVDSHTGTRRRSRGRERVNRPRSRHKPPGSRPDDSDDGG
jgi:transcriptional regulator with XRE-family HTH domain